MDVLGDGVLKFIACRVTVDGEIPDDSPIEAFFDHMSIMHASCGSCRIAKKILCCSEFGMLLSHALPCLYIRGILREAEEPEQLALQMNGFVR